MKERCMDLIQVSKGINKMVQININKFIKLINEEHKFTKGKIFNILDKCLYNQEEEK